MVAGHPFKGGWVFSTGQLAHPDMKRFQINTPMLFAPPNPAKVAGAVAAAAAFPSFQQFYTGMFNGQTLSTSGEACQKMVTSL
jgi:hypothetical protein